MSDNKKPEQHTPEGYTPASPVKRTLAWIALAYVLIGLANAVRSYLEGMGDVVYSSLAGMASLVCRIILSYTLVVFFANMVIAWAEALSWVLLLLLYVVRAVWKERRWKSEGIFQA